jgi:hypothetical protein
MPRTWLAAHTIFVSGITMLYCTWTTPEIKASTSLEEFLSNAATCTKLLEFLGRTWSVAEDAKGKFERLALITSTSWRTAEQDGQNCGDKSLDDLRSPDLTNDFSASADDFQFTAEAWSGADDNVSGLFTGELGDMSSWFDLGWLTDVNPGT